MKKPKTTKTSLINIADVLKSGERLSAGEHGEMRCRMPGLELSIYNSPADNQGGDFHGAVYLENGRTVLFVGDIAGHDFSASIVATLVMKFIEDNQESMAAPNLFIGSMTRSLHQTLANMGRYFTIAVCVVNTELGTLTYASAGHPPALFYSRLRDRVDPVGRKSFPVGFEKEVEFIQVRREFLPGDMLLLYTDGISSARNRKNEEFETSGIERLLFENREAPDKIIGIISESVDAFEGASEHRDDRTMLLAVRL